MTTGRVNPEFRLEDQGITGLGAVYYNLLEPALIEEALKRGEGTLGQGGSFLCSTGSHTGRSPKDKFVVRTPSVEDTIWWENNAPMAPDAFDRLHTDMLAHLRGREVFVQPPQGDREVEPRIERVAGCDRRKERCEDGIVGGPQRHAAEYILKLLQLHAPEYGRN